MHHRRQQVPWRKPSARRKMEAKEAEWERPKGWEGWRRRRRLSLSFRRRLPSYLPSTLGEGDDAAAGLRRRSACGKFKTHKTYKQTSFREEATAPRRHRRHERIADHSLPNANYLYSPLAIKMCRAWTGAEGEGTISAAKGRRNVLQFRRNGIAWRRWNANHVAERIRYNSSRFAIINAW